jgi:hypothetical protein
MPGDQTIGNYSGDRVEPRKLLQYYITICPDVSARQRLKRKVQINPVKEISLRLTPILAVPKPELAGVFVICNDFVTVSSKCEL